MSLHSPDTLQIVAAGFLALLMLGGAGSAMWAALFMEETEHSSPAGMWFRRAGWAFIWSGVALGLALVLGLGVVMARGLVRL